MSNASFPADITDAESVIQSTYRQMSYIKSCEMDVWTKARSAGPALPDAIPGFVKGLEGYLPVVRRAAAFYPKMPDFVNEVEDFVAKRKGKTYAFGQACPWIYK